MGGRLIGWYLSMGEYDGLVIYEAQDDASAEEATEIMRRAGGTAFRAPGQE
jgi:uncharacterized protein with GYD domain